MNTPAFRKQWSAGLTTASPVSSWPADSTSGKVEILEMNRKRHTAETITVSSPLPHDLYFDIQIWLFLFCSYSRLEKNLLRNFLSLGIPGWRSGLAPAFGPRRDPGDPGLNPMSGSRYLILCRLKTIGWRGKKLKLLTEFFTWYHCIGSLSKNEVRFIAVLSK